MNKIKDLSSDIKNGHLGGSAIGSPHIEAPTPKPKSSEHLNYVHIDLKGARPQLHWWINFCRLLRDWGEVRGKHLQF